VNRSEIFERLKSLPILFPMVGAFHVVMLIITTAGFLMEGSLDTAITVGSCIEWLLYSAFWVAVCLQQRRWAAIAYIGLTAINLALQFLTPPASYWPEIGGTLFPFDVLMCFFLLFFYKRLR
jgi:hypothetical protein